MVHRGRDFLTLLTDKRFCGCHALLFRLSLMSIYRRRLMCGFCLYWEEQKRESAAYYVRFRSPRFRNALLSTHTPFVGVGLTRLSFVAPDQSPHKVTVGACFATVISFCASTPRLRAVLLQDDFEEVGVRWAVSSSFERRDPWCRGVEKGRSWWRFPSLTLVLPVLSSHALFYPKQVTRRIGWRSGN